jgi:acyl-CoA thioester hydrolase
MENTSKQSAEVFEIKIAVKATDIDEQGHVNNVIYVRWVQEAALAHWMARATKEQQERLMWLVLRHEIDYKQSAQMGDEILARTWIGMATRARFERLTSLHRAANGVLLAKARTMWCPIDAQTKRPSGITPELQEMFPTGSATIQRQLA